MAATVNLTCEACERADFSGGPNSSRLTKIYSPPELKQVCTGYMSTGTTVCALCQDLIAPSLQGPVRQVCFPFYTFIRFFGVSFIP
jgi:hypothetical protein